MHTLVIDTATERSVVSIFSGSETLYSCDFPVGLKQSEHLVPAISSALKQTNLSPDSFALIVVGNGPGSYTGIRVGIAVAQALAYAHQIAIVPVCSLKGFIPEQQGMFATVIDAKMGGVYYLKGEKKGNNVFFTSDPTMCSIEEAAQQLQDVQYIVTPCSDVLQQKFAFFPINSSYQWIERHPDSKQFLQEGLSLYYQDTNYCGQTLPILYLRKTQAEIELEQKQQ